MIRDVRITHDPDFPSRFDREVKYFLSQRYFTVMTISVYSHIRFDPQQAKAKAVSAFCRKHESMEITRILPSSYMYVHLSKNGTNIAARYFASYRFQHEALLTF